MSGSRPQQSAGGANSVPGTSSSSSSSSTGGSGSNAVTSNGPATGNVVPSRTLGATNEAGSFASLTSRPSASSGSRKKSLHQAPLYNGLLNSYEDKSNDFVWLVFISKVSMKLLFGTAIQSKSNIWVLIKLFSGFFFFLLFSPICFEMIEEAHMTKCGHSFW